MAVINVGDVVQLKSGGPKMVAKNSANAGDYVTCEWFDGKQVKQRDFTPELLIKVDSAEGDVPS
jgi:uncharacterized protein YodC (DUF2158 family)